jgi:hypothetical protein
MTHTVKNIGLFATGFFTVQWFFLCSVTFNTIFFLPTIANVRSCLLFISVKGSAKVIGTKFAGSVTAKAGRAAFKNGKMVLTGVKSGAGRGAKSFASLGKRLAAKLKLKRIKIERRKFRFYIFGEFNPWVLLASGEIREVNINKGDTLGTHGNFKLKNSHISPVSHRPGRSYSLVI